MKVVAADDGRAMYFSRAAIPFLRDAADAPLRARLASGSTLACTPTRATRSRTGSRCPPHPLEQIERLEQLRPLAAGIAMGVALIDEPPRGGIDTEDDLERANARLDRPSPQDDVDATAPRPADRRKYIFVTGGVVSSLGKGIAAASLGRLLVERGLRVIDA